MRYLFLFLPLFSFAQDIVKDTVYMQKQGNTYFIISQTWYEDSTTTGSKLLLGDSLQAIQTLMNKAENHVNNVAAYAVPVITRGANVRQVNFYNSVHQEITGKPIYTSTATRDSSYFIGNWNLIVDGNITPGEIKVNANNRLVFTPDKTKTYTVTTNLLLSTFQNQVTFTYNNVKYDLYKFANSKFSTLDNDIRLIKKQ